MNNLKKETIVNELHRNARKNFNRRCFEMRGIDDTFQADLIEMIPYAKQNKNYKYILTVIDVFSKFAWAIPIKSKTGKEVTKAMQFVFISDNRIPKNLHTDQGKEFYNSNFNLLMNQNKINHYSTFSKLKASIAERFNRTLLTKLWKYFSFQGTYKWINILKNIVNDYNNTKHRTINMKPIDVNKNNEKILLSTVYKKNNTLFVNHEKNQFKKNDFVRISKYKHIFEKGYTPNWTTEIFKIYKVQKTNPVTYLIKDLNEKKIKGSFYQYELQKTKYPNIYLIEKIVRTKGNQLYVKWLGFSNDYNSWINKKDFV